MNARLLPLSLLLAIAVPSAHADGGSVGVAAREFRFSLYRQSVPPGPVRFNVRNLGDDRHDLTVRSTLGRHRVVARSGEIASGVTRTVTVALRPGTYRLVCSVAGHERLGMHARFVVTRGA